MTLRKIIYLTLFLFSFSGCKEDHKYEEKILGDIFSQLVDSLDINWKPLPPEPLPPIYDNDSNLIGLDSTKMRIIQSKHQEYLNRLDSIDSRILIGISDSSFSIDFHDLKSKSFSNDELIRKIIPIQPIKTDALKELDLNEIKVPKQLRLISKSEIEKQYSNIWKVLRNYKFAGLLEISRLYLSENNNFGLLQVAYYYDMWNGYGYFIIIERTDKGWQIKRIFQNWVS